MQIKKILSVLVAMDFVFGILAVRPMAAQAEDDAASPTITVSPVLATDAGDYSPYSPVIITGTGFSADAQIPLAIFAGNDLTNNPQIDSVTTTSNGDGVFTLTCNLGDYIPYYTVIATDPTGPSASVSFTDGQISVSCSPNPVIVNSDDVICIANNVNNGDRSVTIQWYDTSANLRHTSSQCNASTCSDTFKPLSTGAWTVKVIKESNGSEKTSTTLIVNSSKQDQTITLTSTVPSDAKVGGVTYTPTATGGASGNPVVFTIDSSASSVCSISAGGVVSFDGIGTCVIDANQAGNDNYNAAPQVQ